jgi:outer membrane protein
MKYLKMIKFFFIILMFSFNTVSSSEKINFVDVDYIVKNSNIGKKTLEIIDDLDKKNIENIRKKNLDLKDMENAIKKKKNIISKEDFNKEVVDFQNKVQKFTNEKNKIVKNFNDFRNKELQKLFKSIRPLIRDYMEQNSINILIDAKNVFMANDSVNLTEDVLKIINNELK